VDWNALELCALGDPRVDKSLVFMTVPFGVIFGLGIGSLLDKNKVANKNGT